MKKIAFIINGDMYSGAEGVLEKYIKDNLDKIAPFFILIYSEKKIKEKVLEYVEEKNILELNLKNWKFKLNRMFPYFEAFKIKDKIRNFLEVEKIEFLYINNTNEAFIFNYLINWIEKPYLVHIHDMQTSFKDPIRRYFGHKFLANYDSFITVSNATKNSWKNKEEFKVVYNGIDEEFFDLSIERKNNQLFNIGFIGQCNKRKGFDRIRKIINYYKKFKDIKFIIITNSISKKDLEEIKKVKNTEIYTNLNKAQMKKKYMKLDLLLIPSRFDPLPTVILEAIASETFVLGQNIGGIPEMIPEVNLVDFDSIEQVVQKIKEVREMNFTSLKNIKKDIKNIAKDRFNINKKNNEINKMIFKD